jgi:hypothetical protein
VAGAADIEGVALRQLRQEANLPDDVQAKAIGAVLRRCGDDEDLALTALTMIPGPEWVSELLGLHPERKVGI